MCDRSHLRAEDDQITWKELFPDGRFIYYECDDPEGFIKEIKKKFGFDPLIKGFGFYCPAELLDEIYGSKKYPMGS
jgi:hypothetical protein